MRWVSEPEEVEAMITGWVKEYPSLISVESITQFTGHRVHALSVTDKSVKDEAKVRGIFIVPHAHEPAGTAACMDVVNHLLTGESLMGEATEMDRRGALAKLILTFVPDANPYGRSRSPERWWDGAKYSNEDFLNIAFGVDEDGGRFHRYGRWCSLEHKSKTIGIVYEKVWHYTYVEPNRDWSSSYYKILFKMLPENRYNLILELHQTEFESQPYNAEVMLPILQENLPEKIRKYNEEWGRDLVEALNREKARSKPEPKPLGYTGEQKEYFVRYEGFITRTTPSITVEVQNNNTGTPPEKQLKYQEAAIKVTIEKMLTDKEPPPSSLLKGF